MYKTYQFALVTGESLITTTPFGLDNDDFDCTAAEMLSEYWDSLYDVQNAADLQAVIDKLNAEHFQDDEEHRIKIHQFPNLYDKPIATYFLGEADYVLAKNLTEEEQKIAFKKDKKEFVCVLDNEDIVALNLGEVLVTDSDDFTKLKMIEELESFKENLSGNMNSNYSELWNMCADFDNENRGMYLTDTIQEAEFVDDDLLGEYMKSQDLTDISRLRCFIGDTYSDDIYRFDGYGNLANVDSSDFEEVIDNLLYELNAAVQPRYEYRKAMEM
jgi:hypothetical protein